MNNILQNKWILGKAYFEFISIPNDFNSYNGIFTLNATLDKSIGTEVLLFIRDETDFIYDIAKVKPLKLLIKWGLFSTKYGPVMSLLFYIPDFRYKDRPFVMFDMHLNPVDHKFLIPYYNLSQQAYWHLFLLNNNNEQIEFFEFKNTFNLYHALYIVEGVCKDMKSIDFLKAQEEFKNKYSLEDLYRMKDNFL